jgi:uncharacterized protein YgiM (DUF1202 family)
MRMSSRVMAATVLSAAAAMGPPVFAQQEAPPPGQAPQPGASGPTAPTQQGEPPPAPAPSVPPQAAPTGSARFAVVSANVNLRSGPNTNSEIITTIPAGSRVQVTDCTGEWCMVTWNQRSGFAIARNLDTGGARQARRYRAPSGYAGGPPPGYPYGPPVVYGPPVYYPPPAIVYAPGYYFGPRYYGWHRRW